MLPESVTSIGEGAFQDCHSLTSMEISEHVTSIGKNTFNGCIALSSIKIAEGNIHYDSRENCNAVIETATNTLLCGCGASFIPESVTSIEEFAFYGISSLASITIPRGLTSIGKYAFSDCTALSALISYATTPPTCGLYPFVSVNKESCTIYVPEESVELYKAAEYWKDFVNIRGLSESAIDAPAATDEKNSRTIYDLNGRRLPKLQKGLNIVNGRKVLTR